MTSPDETSDQLKALALKLAAFTELLEQRSAQVVQQTIQSSEAIARTVHVAATSSEHLTAKAIGEFKAAASDAVAIGLRTPMEEAGRTMQSGTQSIQAATRDLEARVRAVGKTLTAHAWKTFIASALASLVVIGVAVYMGRNAHRELTRAEWVGQINAAIANGKLVKCHDGGLCAHVGKQWVRLDQ